LQTIFVFSHLRWSFVYQRPQHLLSRLARHYRIVFFEEPEFHPGDATLRISHPAPNVTVYTPSTPLDETGFPDSQLDYLRPMVRELGACCPDAIVWLYTPMALPLAELLEPRCLVYDCMDELSAFRNAPQRLIEREDMLLARADVVFTGGPSLYNAKRHRNPNVHCFPSSVDVLHFRQALDRSAVHPSQHTLPHPRLGFYGVLDERFDVPLIAEVAQARPQWQIVLVGPVAKKTESMAFPRAPNIHYLGQQSYESLPRFLAAWDVCLMPFAINESTRFISPTKSLEYMAAELPIVSTPVKDVVDLHSDVIDIAENAREFIAACERALQMEDETRQRKIRLMRDKLSRTSWDTTAATMHALLEQMATGDTTIAAPMPLYDRPASSAQRMAGGRE